MQVDIRIDGIWFYSIIGATPEGQQFVSDRVHGGENGVAYSDQTNLTEQIAEGATEHGLTVTVNGYVYLRGGLRGEAA